MGLIRLKGNTNMKLIGIGIGLGLATVLVAAGCSSSNDTASTPATDAPSISVSVNPDTTSVPTGDTFLECQQEYAELVKKIALNPGAVTPEQTQKWADEARKAGEQAASGDLDGAKDTICKSVEEMSADLG